MRLRRLLAPVLAFTLPPLVIGIVSIVATLLPHRQMEAVRPLAGGQSVAIGDARPRTNPSEPGGLAPSAGLPGRTQPTALLLMGRPATEVSDLLGPFELLREAGFHVYTVADGLDPVGLTGSLAAVPDFALADAPTAELIVVPAVVNHADPALMRWLRERAASATILLSVCEGARLVAGAGLMDGRRATTHFFALDGLQEQYPDVRFLPGHRYIADGPLLSSAGVTAAFDATLHAIETLTDRTRAEDVARRLSYNWTRESDPRGDQPRGPTTRITAADVARLVVDAGYDWKRRTVGVLVYPGVDEMQLAAALDSHWRTLRAKSLTVSETRRPIRTRMGMTLIATAGFDELDERGIELDLLVVPGGSPAGVAARAVASSETADRPEPQPPSPLMSPAVLRWRANSGVEVVSFLSRAAGSAVSDQLELIERLAGPASAAVVAKQIEHPLERDHLAPQDRAGEWDSRLLPTALRPLALGALGVAVWLALRGRSPLREQQPRMKPFNRVSDP